MAIEAVERPRAEHLAAYVAHVDYDAASDRKLSMAALAVISVLATVMGVITPLGIYLLHQASGY